MTEYRSGIILIVAAFTQTGGIKGKDEWGRVSDGNPTNIENTYVFFTYHFKFISNDEIQGKLPLHSIKGKY